MGGIGSGRPARPQETKQLMGDKPSRINDDAPEFDKAARDIPPPDALSPEEAEIWRYHAGPLARAKVLTMMDLPALAEYCVCVAKAREAHDHVRAEGAVLEDSHGKSYVNPWHRVHKEALADMMRLSSRFGLTPADRARVQVISDDDPGGNNPESLLS